MNKFDHTTKEGREAMAAASNAAAVQMKKDIQARGEAVPCDFWGWFDHVTEAAGSTAVGKIMTAHNYTVSHTGGGCLTWERMIDDKHYLWICDEGNGLGESPDERYLVGCYDSEGAFDQHVCRNLAAALRWCEKRHRDPQRFIDKYQGKFPGGYGRDN